MDPIPTAVGPSTPVHAEVCTSALTCPLSSPVSLRSSAIVTAGYSVIKAYQNHRHQESVNLIGGASLVGPILWPI